MKVTRRYNQTRRDLTIDIKCEGCGNIEEDKNAYDDRNFWDNVVPSWKCSKCNKSSNDLGTKKQQINTRYPEEEQH